MDKLDLIYIRREQETRTIIREISSHKFKLGIFSLNNSSSRSIELDE